VASFACGECDSIEYHHQSSGIRHIGTSRRQMRRADPRSGSAQNLGGEGPYAMQIMTWCGSGQRKKLVHMFSNLGHMLGKMLSMNRLM
jgi:hypothetical protein